MRPKLIFLAELYLSKRLIFVQNFYFPCSLLNGGTWEGSMIIVINDTE